MRCSTCLALRELLFDTDVRRKRAAVAAETEEATAGAGQERATRAQLNRAACHQHMLKLARLLHAGSHGGGS